MPVGATAAAATRQQTIDKLLGGMKSMQQRVIDKLMEAREWIRKIAYL